MAGPFYFAWVDDTDSVFSESFARSDEIVLGLEIGQDEGDFAVLIVEIRNPRTGLLRPGRKRWAWLSWDGDHASSAGTEPLFFGRLVGIPQDVQGEAVRLTFRAKPKDYDTRKRALAEALRQSPYWDPVWIEPVRRDDPDVALEARSALWHVDRITHALTISDIVAGEDGTVVIGPDIAIADSLDLSFGEAPLRSVTIDAEVSWDQQASGSVDITPRIVAAFRDAGTIDPGLVSSYTGQGLYDDWPKIGDGIGSGWEFGDVSIDRVDGTAVPAVSRKVVVSYETAPTDDSEATQRNPVSVYVPLMKFLASVPVDYQASRARKETIRFTVTGDVQELLSDVGDDETDYLSFASSEVGELADGTGSAAAYPISDLRRNAYFPTDRGLQSIEYLLAVARTRILARARTAKIGVDVPFHVAAGVSCRMNATIIDDRLPGGTATGKIIGYRFACDGDSGAMTGSIVVACCVGRGSTVSAEIGSPAYVDDGYVNDGYQMREGIRVLGADDSILYTPPLGNISDDGVNFFDMTADAVVEDVTVTGGVYQQFDVLRGSHIDIRALSTALNEVKTVVSLDLVPLQTGPFETSYDIDVSAMTVPKTIDLEAV